MRPWRSRGWRRDEGGQLLLISGVVITLAFLLSALTLSQVSSLERQAAAEKPTTLLSEWRFLHERMGTNLETAVTPDTKIQTFTETTFPTIAATFRNIEAEKGYDTVIRLASDLSKFNKTERSLITPALPATGTHYNAMPLNSDTPFTHAVEGPQDDGIIWQTPCPHSAGPSTGCIVGVVVFVRITDGVSSLEEVMVFRVNQE